MKIQCDVCEKAQATVICCADEAALCAKCDVEVHAANKLASKHQRLLLECLSSKLPRCDICQERPAFIFCVEDRALFCKECDEPIHSANSRAAKHQRFLATGIRVALSSGCCKEDNSTFKMDPIPPKSNVEQTAMKTPSQHISSISSPGWAVDDLLQFSDYESSGKKDQLDLSELEWLTNNYLFNEQATPRECFGAAEVPQMRVSQSNNMASSYRQAKSYPVHKKPRYEIQDDEEDFFTVPDLG